MIGYRIDWGIWNKAHSITSRDTGESEIRKTEGELQTFIREKEKYFATFGYEIWFYKIVEIEIELCTCGKLKQKDYYCWYCGKGQESKPMFPDSEAADDSLAH